jgi:SNF2 family DNA or RNA helicase
MLVPHLRERYGVEVPFLHGGVPRASRDAMVEQFSGGGAAQQGGPPVMLLSLRAGGTGLNLVAANHVVHVDRWWNPAVEAQATDRAFRIGQTRQVQVRKLVCVGTVEERVDELMARKAALAASVVGSGEGWLTELSTADLHDLLRLGTEAVGD